MTIQIEPTWKEVLQEEFEKTYFKNLTSFLKAEKKANKIIYPPGPSIFKAFDSCPWNEVKVIILGQDPYHGPNQAMGLSFSVPKNQKIPPSLRNIYKELNNDIQMDIPRHGDLSNWANQGVFLLNSMLSVESGKAGSHQKKGWEEFTDAIIQQLSSNKENLVFLLWGNYAKSKGAVIDRKKHLVLEAAHPSPLAGGKFFGCRHFSKTNSYLRSKDLKPIQWEALNY